MSFPSSPSRTLTFCCTHWELTIALHSIDFWPRTESCEFEIRDTAAETIIANHSLWNWRLKRFSKDFIGIGCQTKDFSDLQTECTIALIHQVKARHIAKFTDYQLHLSLVALVWRSPCTIDRGVPTAPSRGWTEWSSLPWAWRLLPWPITAVLDTRPVHATGARHRTVWDACHHPR